MEKVAETQVGGSALKITIMKKINIKLILEKGRGEIWGRVDFEGDLIIESAGTQEVLEEKIKGHLKHFHDLIPSRVEFDVTWEK